MSGPSGLLNRVDELLNKRKCPCSLLSHALSGGLAGAEKAVKMYSIHDLLSDSFFAYECTMFCPRRVAMRQVTFECNCGSNLTD